MTEMLKTLLDEQAASVDLARPDLAAITAVGERRVRRRRVAALGGGLATLILVGGLVAVAVGGDRGGPQVAGDPLTTRAVSWATGSTLHAGGTSRDLGHHIAAYVRTDAGYVFADDDGVVFSYADGSVDRVGTTAAGAATRLVADSAGTLTGWVDPSGGRPSFVVLDQATGEVERYDAGTRPGSGTLPDDKDPTYFYAIDDRTAYWRSATGAEAVDLTTGAVTPVDRAARNGFDLIDVEAGTSAFYDDHLGVVVGPTRDGAEPLDEVLESSGELSPDARYYAPDADALRLVEVATGRDVALRLPAPYFFATGYGWLDGDTLAVIALLDEAAPVSLLTCTVSTGVCDVVTDDAGAPGEAQIAVGERIGS